MPDIYVAPLSPREECERAISRAATWHVQRAEAEWAKTEIGDLFLKYESATARAWQRDCNPTASGKSLRVAWERAEAARRNFLVALREF